MRFEQLLWITKWVLINTSLPRESGLFACISSRITTVIQVVREYNQINDNWFNEPFAVSQYKCLYLDMHGLIFETSIWYWQDQPVNYSIERNRTEFKLRPVRRFLLQPFLLFVATSLTALCAHDANDDDDDAFESHTRQRPSNIVRSTCQRTLETHAWPEAITHNVRHFLASLLFWWGLV